MKVLAINGSPKENGSTASALRFMAETLAGAGIETEIAHIGKGPVQGCTGCNGCDETRDGKCIYNDNINAAFDKLNAADGLILGAPTYYGGIAGGAKSAFDRLFYMGADLKGKPAAAITVARRSGGEDTFHQLNSYLTLSGAVIAPSTYWNVIHGNSGEEIMRDTEGVRILRCVCESMAWLLNIIHAAKNSVPFPEMKRDAWMNFIR
ncbi:MAG: flavodoxin family protein [Oscillospiraceae bacterium]|jgi:multimeric flavodoxin WrbA|nr:flavodoxin family protein [Oscillospiraceae bacterium]